MTASLPMLHQMTLYILDWWSLIRHRLFHSIWNYCFLDCRQIFRQQSEIKQIEIETTEMYDKKKQKENATITVKEDKKLMFYPMNPKSDKHQFHFTIRTLNHSLRS